MTLQGNEFNNILDIFHKNHIIRYQGTYEPLREDGPVKVADVPCSSFRLTASHASQRIVFNQFYYGYDVCMDQVRIEEFMNSFEYCHETQTDDFISMNAELSTKPSGKKLMYIHVRAAEQARKRQNVVLLLDTSKTMGYSADIAKATAAAIIRQLHPGDRFSLIFFSDECHIPVRNLLIQNESEIAYLLWVVMMDPVFQGNADGIAGLKTSFSLSSQYFDEDGANQVFIVSDGNYAPDFPENLRAFIRSEKNSKLSLCVIGTGMYDFRDNHLIQLAKHIGALYNVVNTPEEIRESIERSYLKFSAIAARDVKMQVTFNPLCVASFRLLGYENRQLSNKQFEKADNRGEPFGSGGYGIVLYELDMCDPADRKTVFRSEQDDSEVLCTIELRYKEPCGHRRTVHKIVRNTDDRTDNLDQAYDLYCIAEYLRNSEHLDPDDRKRLEKIMIGQYTLVFKRDRYKMEKLADTLRCRYWDRADIRKPIVRMQGNHQ